MPDTEPPATASGAPTHRLAVLSPGLGVDPRRTAPGTPRDGQWLVELVAVLAPTALAAALVLYDLGSRSLWIDEGATFTTASQHGSALIHAALGDGGNMFFYYLGMHLWFAVFGSSELSLRMPTALAAIATVPICYWLIKRLFDVRAAVFAAFFVAVSAPFVYWAQNARAYSVAIFFVCASALAFVIAVQTNRRLAWAVYVVLAALSVYMILLSVLAVVAYGTSLAFRQPRARLWVPLLISSAAIAVLVAPLAWVAAQHGTQSIQWLPTTGPIYGATARGVLGILASAHNDVPVINHILLYVVTIAMVLCWLLGGILFLGSLVRFGRTDQAWACALLIAWLLVPPVIEYVISVAVQPVFDSRYVLVSLVPASLLAGVALARLRPVAIAVGAGVALLVVRALTLTPTYGVSIENWRQGVTELVSQAKPNDCIAFFVEDGYTAFDYYVLHLPSLPGPLPRSVLPDVSWESRSRYSLDPAAIPSSRMPAVVASCPRLWLVTSHALGSPPGPGVLPYRVRVYETHEALLSELSAAYRETTAWTFVGADVSLYVRTK